MIIYKQEAFLLPKHSMQAGILMGRYVWEIEFFNSKGWFGFGFAREYQYYSIESNKWEKTHTGNIDLFVNLKSWDFGPDHFWYDGPHCHYSFGPFHLNMSRSNCKKCKND